MGCESHRAFLFFGVGRCGAVGAGDVEFEGEVEEIGGGGAEAPALGGSDGGGEKRERGKERVGEGGFVGEGGAGGVEKLRGERGRMGKALAVEIESGADLNGIGESFGGLI